MGLSYDRRESSLGSIWRFRLFGSSRFRSALFGTWICNRWSARATLFATTMFCWSAWRGCFCFRTTASADFPSALQSCSAFPASLRLCTHTCPNQFREHFLSAERASSWSSSKQWIRMPSMQDKHSFSFWKKNSNFRHSPNQFLANWSDCSVGWAVPRRTSGLGPRGTTKLSTQSWPAIRVACEQPD